MKTRIFLILALITGAMYMNVAAQTPATDPYAYPALKDGKYTLTNKWIYSVPTGTYGTNFNLQPSIGAGTARHMAYRNGKLLISSRSNPSQLSILTVDAATGAVEDSVKLAASVFSGGSYPNNAICVDNAGNVLVSNIGFSWNALKIYKIDMATGEGTQLVSFAGSRVDHIGVWGDVNNHAVIYAPVSGNEGGDKIYRWTITNGQVVNATPDEIRIDYTAGGFNVDNPGMSTNCYPLTEQLVYFEGYSTYPTLLYINGNEAFAADSYYDLQDASLPIPDGLIKDENTKPGITLGMESDCNGFAHFQIGDDYFFVRPVKNYMDYSANENADPLLRATAPTSFRVYKYKDESILFREAEGLWTFPAAGLGTNPSANGVYSVAASVEGNKAYIYIYSPDNGIAAYELNTQGETGIKPLKAGLAVYYANNAIQFGAAVAFAQVYNLTGQLIAQAKHTASVAIAIPGIYLVKATALNGETVVDKVIVK
ncbi:MAG: hypothetical protein LBH19_02215 [Dysgonamonadaceae bacterium]|jgi:hypothetical protein|nr:hypothetical protein [Dysgonamonadaceae bacterium]